MRCVCRRDTSAGIYDPQHSLSCAVGHRGTGSARANGNTWPPVEPANRAVLPERPPGRLLHRPAAAVLSDAVRDPAGLAALGLRLVRPDRRNTPVASTTLRTVRAGGREVERVRRRRSAGKEGGGACPTCATAELRDSAARLDRPHSAHPPVHPVRRDDPETVAPRRCPVPARTEPTCGRNDDGADRQRAATAADPDNDGGYWRLDEIKPGRYSWAYGTDRASLAPRHRRAASAPCVSTGTDACCNWRPTPIRCRSRPASTSPRLRRRKPPTCGPATKSLFCPIDSPDASRRLTLYPQEPLAATAGYRRTTAPRGSAATPRWA